MARRIAARKERVPYLRERVIEEHAQLLLDEWGAVHGEITLPIPLDDLVELHLGLTYEVEDLCGRFGSADVLGAIWFNENIIRVDASLDPSKHPQMLGRFNFTLAHEIGHWRLHREHLRNDPNEATLFEDNGEPAFVCRSSAKPREERQADMFASCLMAPRAMVRKAWATWRSSDDPVAVTQLDVVDFLDSRQANERAAMEKFCKPLAARFDMSAQAMRIRLETLELLVKEIEPRLF